MRDYSAEVERTRQKVIAAGLQLAQSRSYATISRTQIARIAGCSPATVSNVGTISQVRALIMAAAVEQRVMSVIAQGLSLNDPVALAADESLRADALLSVMG